jgi:hypothetical protein
LRGRMMVGVTQFLFTSGTNAGHAR